MASVLTTTKLVQRMGRRRTDSRPLFLPGELLCDIDGFSLHAKVRIEPHDREGLERSCRYVSRPPLKGERLSLASDGRVIYALRRRWRDGTSAIVLDPLDFLSRLAALVPRPRAHLLTYHGVLAPAAGWRDLIVPGPKSAPITDALRARSPPDPTPDPRRPIRPTWAELMRRVFVFAIDVLLCPRCGGTRKLIALLTDGLVVRKILTHLGLEAEPPCLAPARAPPEPELAW